MTPLEYIREKCVEANPSIMELKFGCEVVWNKKRFIYITDVMAGLATIWSKEGSAIFKPFHELEILGRPLTLADVILAIQKQELPFEEKHKYLRTIAFVLWGATKSFDNQKPEVHAFIAEVLGWKGESV